MRIGKLEVHSIDIPFKTSFRHASADRSNTAGILVLAEAEDGSVSGYGESCPREYVTGESMDTVRAFFSRHRDTLMAEIDGLPSLLQWMASNHTEVEDNPAAWCAIELALLDLLGRTNNQSFEAMLSLPGIVGPFTYSAVLGDGSAAAFEKQARQYIQTGFRDFKIKLSGDIDTDRGKISCLSSFGQQIRLRADANNLWAHADEVIAHLDALGQPFWAVEEPLRSGDFQGMEKIAKDCSVKVILDESCTRGSDLDYTVKDPGLWVPNLRVSKMGGLIRSLEVLGRARAQGHGVIIGAHVGETSILTRAGLTLAWAGSDIRLAMEGAFGTHLLDHDISASPVMFGQGGVLPESGMFFANAHGNGLQIKFPH